MANIKFLTGNAASNLLATNSDGSYKVAITPGNVYFTTDGKIYFDTTSSERKCMQDSVSYAATAGSFSTAKSIALTGDVTGSASGGTSGGWSITTTVKDDSHDHTNFLKLDGARTMTGALKLKASANSEGLATGALNLQNSNINHVHTIYFDAYSTPNVPGLYFYRDTTHVDGLYAKDGILYFAPNKEISNASYTSHIILTSNNYNSYAPTKTGTGASGTWGISISGKAATAGSADKITTDAGSATLPVYFYGGVPVQCSSTLGVSITGNAATATKATSADSASSATLAASATKLATPRTFEVKLGQTNTSTFDGTANVTLGVTGTLPISSGGTGATSAINALANLDARYRWTATIKCATWSRLCYVTCQASVVGAKYILNIGATRSNVVYNDTFLVTAHHSSNGKIIKLAGNNYSKGYQVRLLADSNGNNYFELYDNCNSATNSTTQTVYCNLIPISTGAITRYTAFTDGTTLPTNFTVKQTMTIDNTDIQANLSGNAATATSATGADKLNTARTINGTSFNGTANITTANWGTARNIYIADSSAANTGAAVSVNGSGNVTLKLPTTIKATLAGNASTATTLATARTINGTSFNGSANITTANWGTSRTITIGSAGKSVNGSTNYSWTLAEILGSSVISAANLPSYVDDVLEVASYSNLPTTGEAGKIYVCLDNNKTYRWSGSTYVHISSPIVIGTTSGTAYDGGSGASLATTVANHTGNKQNPHGVTTSQIGAVAKSGDTMTGNLIQKNVTLNNGVNNVTAIVAYDDGDSYNYGSELVIGANGNTFLGAGESPASLRSSLSGGGSTVTNENYGRTSENLYLTSDNNIYLETNCNTIANRKCVSIDTSAKVTAPGGFVGNVTGNVSGSAATLATSRTLTIGNTGKSFNGSANVSWSLAEIGAVPISGGTMTGQLKTSFNNSIATGSYQAAANTLENLLEEVRYSSGCMGSVNLTTAYGSIVAGWYNFLYIPHRSGGINGGTNGDNCNYGTLLLYGMTIGGAGAHWRIQYTSSKIGTVQQVVDTNTWRGIQNNLTSTSTTDSLSAAMGKSLNDKFANYLPLSGGTLTGNLTAPKVYGAVWNDYAEFREGETIKPGYCVRSSDCGKVSMTNERLSMCDGIVSDTFGFAIGETEDAKVPLAVAGRVLACCEGERESYHAGDAVCASINGKVSKMTREEIKEWPDRIVGVVSEIPDYEIWGTGNVKVDGRIWIKVR